MVQRRPALKPKDRRQAEDDAFQKFSLTVVGPRNLKFASLQAIGKKLRSSLPIEVCSLFRFFAKEK